MMKYRVLLFISLILSCLGATEIGLECKFVVVKSGVYTCMVLNLKTLVGDELIASVSGKQVNINTINDVLGIIADHNNNQITHLPNGFGLSFPSLQAFRATSVELKYIRRENFANMGNLSILTLSGNQILSFSGDVFMDLPKLEWLSIHTNQISVLPEELLANMPKLVSFYFGANLAHNLPEKVFASNLNVEEIYIRSGKLKTVDVDFSKLPKIREVHLEANTCTNDFFSSEQNGNMTRFMLQLQRTCRKISKEGFKLI